MNGYYQDDGCPLRCVRCNGFDIEDKIVDTINYIASERELICMDCKTVVGYWAYGSYDPSYITTPQNHFDEELFKL